MALVSHTFACHAIKWTAGQRGERSADVPYDDRASHRWNQLSDFVCFYFAHFVVHVRPPATVVAAFTKSSSQIIIRFCRCYRRCCCEKKIDLPFAQFSIHFCVEIQLGECDLAQTHFIERRACMRPNELQISFTTKSNDMT